MDSLEIFKKLRAIAGNRYFYGVYPANKLPRTFLKPAIFVVNTDPSHKEGTHWLAMYIPRKGPAEYFDSYGLKPKYFKKFLNRNASSYIYSNKRLQGDYSSYCGHYCCVFLHCRSRGVKMQELLKIFSQENFNRNDEIIFKMYKRIFSRKQHGGGGGGDDDDGGKLICKQICKSRRQTEYKTSSGS